MPAPAVAIIALNSLITRRRDAADRNKSLVKDAIIKPFN